MADEVTEAQGTESPEAQARKAIAQRDEKIADLERQLAASRKVSAVESYLRQRNIPEAEIGNRVELLSPHLTEIPMDGIPDALAQDRFKALTSAAPAPTPNGSEGEGEGETTPTAPSAPEGGFGNQPSPGGNDQPVTPGKVGPGDDEYERAREAARLGDHSKMQKLYDDERVAEPTRTW